MEVGLSAVSAMGRLCILLLLLGNAAAEVLPSDVVFQLLPPPPPPPHSTHQPEPAHGLTGEEKAWIAVGVSALAVAAVALLVYCCITGGHVQPPRAAEPRRAEIVVRMPPLDVRMA